MDTIDTLLEFGTKRENEERRDGGGAVVFDPGTQKYAVGKVAGSGVFLLFSGGVEPEEDLQEGVLREVVEESGLHDFLYVEKMAEVFAHYHNTLKNVNRVTKVACFLVVLKSTDLVDTQLEEHETFSLHWESAEEILSSWEASNQVNDLGHWVYFLKKSVARAKELGYDTVSEIDAL